MLLNKIYIARSHLSEKVYVYVHISIHLIYGKGMERCMPVEESRWSTREVGKEMPKMNFLFFIILCCLHFDY